MKAIAKDLLSRNDWVILDTETTGLDNRAEAVQIGVLSSGGEVLLNTLVKPVRPLTAELTAIHGITNEMVADAPTFVDILPALHQAVLGKTVVVYNAPYDNRIISQSFAQYSRPLQREQFKLMTDIMAARWLDVMSPYAEHYGEWDVYRQSWRWQKLVNAVRQQGLKVADAHTAIGDCLLTMALIKAVGEK